MSRLLNELREGDVLTLFRNELPDVYKGKITVGKRYSIEFAGLTALAVRDDNKAVLYISQDDLDMMWGVVPQDGTTLETCTCCNDPFYVLPKRKPYFVYDPEGRRIASLCSICGRRLFPRG